MTYTRGREARIFYKFIFVVVDCPKNWGEGSGIRFISCVCGESSEAPRDQHKLCVSASDAGVDNECHLSTFMNYWDQFPQLSRLPLTDSP